MDYDQEAELFVLREAVKSLYRKISSPQGLKSREGLQETIAARIAALEDKPEVKVGGLTKIPSTESEVDQSRRRRQRAALQKALDDFNAE